MSWQKPFKALCVLLLAAVSFVPCGAEPDTRARAEVFSREIAKGDTRLIFSWDSREKVPFTIRNEDNRVVLHFEEPVALHWDASLKAVSPFIKEVESEDDGKTVVLTLSHTSKARHYREDGVRKTGNDTSGLDLVGIKSAAPTVLAAAQTQSEAEMQPEPVQKPAPRKKTKAKKLAKAKSTHIAANEEARKMATLAPSAGIPASAISPPPPLGPSPQQPVTAPAATAQPIPKEIAAPVTTPAPVPAPIAVATPPAPAPVAQPITIQPAEKVALPLSLKDDEPLAVFIWQKNLWIVTDSAVKLSPEELKKSGAPLVSDVHVLPDPGASIVYMPLESDISASVAKAPPDHLQITLQNGAGHTLENIVPTLATGDKGKTALSLIAGKATQNISFVNPLTGDKLNVIPVPQAGSGVPFSHSFVQFSLLQTAQGIAVQNLSDAVTVSLDKGKVVIAAPDGLAISPEVAQQLQDMEADALLAHTPSVLFSYARWKLEDEKTFVPTEMRLMGEISAATGDAANKLRMKLLGLYLGKGLYPQALGLSNDILRNSLKFYRDNKISAMRGAAYLFMYRINEAERDFSAPELDSDPEAVMLRNLCRELLGEGKEPFNFVANYDKYISHYPPPFIQQLGIIAADRSINRKDYDTANAIFEDLKRDNFDEPVKKYIDYMRGKVLSETHDEAEAAKIWEGQAKDLDDPLIRARAEFSLINMLLKSGKITHDDAAKRLEKLRIVWRGDSLELGVLTLLGNLYVQDKQYAKALHTMRDIVLYYQEVPEAVATAQQMESIFVMLYNKNGADAMPPLEALALFYEFRDLVPLGKDGDLMIRNLADRLVSIDLLDRAALLLDHQIRNRLSGEDRSRVAAELAHVYLLNHQPEEALGILKTTGYGDLPPDLQMMRLRLTAQALAQQGNAAKAIDVISTDNSTEGTTLRLSIYWGSKDWQNVITMAEDVLGNRNDPSAPLTKDESEVLLKLATAYVYEHDTGQLQYLRDYFTPLMKNNKNRDSFLFITSESGNIDYDNLANLDQDIGSVKNFLAKSQDKPGKDGFTKLTN